jgi:uncharacterized protein YhhL (DUF1145 family)
VPYSNSSKILLYSRRQKRERIEVNRYFPYPSNIIVSVTTAFIIMVMMIIIMMMVTEARFGVHQASHIR